MVAYEEIFGRVARVSLSGKLEGIFAIADAGGYVRDTLLSVAYWCLVGRQEGVHHHISAVVLNPGEYGIAVEQVFVLSEPDPSPALRVPSADNKVYRVILWFIPPD